MVFSSALRELENEKVYEDRRKGVVCRLLQALSTLCFTVGQRGG